MDWKLFRISYGRRRWHAEHFFQGAVATLFANEIVFVSKQNFLFSPALLTTIFVQWHNKIPCILSAKAKAIQKLRPTVRTAKL